MNKQLRLVHEQTLLDVAAGTVFFRGLRSGRVGLDQQPPVLDLLGWHWRRRRARLRRPHCSHHPSIHLAHTPSCGTTSAGLSRNDMLLALAIAALVQMPAPRLSIVVGSGSNAAPSDLAGTVSTALWAFSSAHHLRQSPASQGRDRVALGRLRRGFRLAHVRASALISVDRHVAVAEPVRTTRGHVPQLRSASSAASTSDSSVK